MPLTSQPSKIDASIGRVKSDNQPVEDLNTQVPAAEWERIKSYIIDVCDEVGNHVGAAGDLNTRIDAVETALASAVILADGTIPMAADLDLGGNNVINVGLVDGRDVSADGAALDAHVADVANPHTTTLQHVVDAQGGSVVSVGDAEPVIVEAEAGSTVPALELRTNATASGPALKVDNDGGGHALVVTDGTDDILLIDAAGDIRTPDITAVAGAAEPIAIQVGQGGPGDATPTSPADGSPLAIYAGRGGDHGGSGAAGHGGDLLLYSGLGGSATDAEGSPGNVIIGARMTVGASGTTAGLGNVIIFTGSALSPTTHKAILIAAEDEDIYLMPNATLQVGYDGAGVDVRMYERSADPGSVANSGALYVKDVGGVTELNYADADGDVTQLSRTKIKQVSTSTYTLLDEDNGACIYFTHASGCTVTVPATLKWGHCTALVTTEYQQKVTLSAGGTLSFAAPPSAASPPASAEDWAAISVLMIDTTASAEVAHVFGHMALV